MKLSGFTGGEFYGVEYLPSKSGYDYTGYSNSFGSWSNFDPDEMSWVQDDALKTITLSTAQTVSKEFYNWAITGGNLVKQ